MLVWCAIRAPGETITPTITPTTPTTPILASTFASGALRGAVAAAACDGVIAVVLADSHQVFVLGRREAVA